MVSKRFIVTCAAVAVVTLIGQDDNDHSNGKSALVMVCKVIIVAITTDALVGCLFTLFSSSYSCSEIETIEDDHIRWTKPEFGWVKLTSSSSTPNSEQHQHCHFESSARRVIKNPDDDDHALSLNPNDESIPSSQNIRWTKPESGWVKLNVDGSRDHKSHPRSSGCGGVLRDASGKWLLGFAQKLDPSLEVHETEIEAILKGLELARDMNIKKLVVESDHKSAVSMVENGVKYNDKQFDIISRIRELRFDPKWEVKVVHVPREANKVANRLANDARDLPFEYLRKYPYPPANCTTLVEEDAQVHRVFYC